MLTPNELDKMEILRLSNEEANKITKECLQTALLILMENKPLEKITITEIVNRSGVSRSAFYRNYSTKENLLEDIYNSLSNTVCDAINSIKYSRGANGF